MTELAATQGGAPRVGRYELCAEIASGGMGRVYLGRARGPGGFEKLVAVKTVHPDLTEEPQFIEMFLDEARIAARIDHRNVCQVFDFGEADGRYFIAMEFLVGEPVQRVLRKLTRREREPDDDRIIARIVAEAAEGLHAAHELTDELGEPLHVVHRDVSPQNVFVTYDGGVRIVDFGVARARGRLHQTEADSLKGKISYMAPETMLRNEVDRRADVWGLGVILWELLAGSRLVRGANEVDIILNVTREPAPRVVDRRPDIDPELESIAWRALQLDPEDRFASAREMAEALERWIARQGEPVGMSQLAEYMRRHFAEERAAAFELVDSVRQSSSGITRARLDPTRPIRNQPPPLPAPGADDDDDVWPTLELEVDVEPPARPARPAWMLPAFAALGGGLVVGAVVLGLALLRSDPPPVHASPLPIEAAAGVAPAAGDRDAPGGSGEALPSETSATSGVDADEHVEAEARPSEVPPSEANPPEAEPEPREADAPGPSRREARRRVATPRTGELRVDTPGGWADVYVDGRRVGRTPLRTQLPSGSARVELRPYGLPPPASASSMRRRVTIGADPAIVRVPL